jgi:FixJ family two-component response regulator
MAREPEPEISERIGAFCFLEKPFRLQRLLHLLERGTELSQRSAALRAHSDEALGRIRYVRVVGPLG